MKLIIIVLSILYCPAVSAQFLPDKPASIHIDQREVSNEEWAAFIRFMKTDPAFSPTYIRSMHPDRRATTQNEGIAVTGVSWKQATAYCKWRSTLATYLNTHTKGNTYRQMLTDNERAKIIITYRLPTEEEWKRMALNKNGVNSPKAGSGFRCVYVCSTKKIA